MLKGSLVALVTPMEEDGGIDYGTLQRLVDFHVENKTDGIISVGTSGESATMDIDQQIEVIGKTVEFSGGRIPVIAGTGGNSTTEAIELTSRAAEFDIHSCLLVVPYYNKPTQHGLYLHFKLIAETVDIPQILYNVPGRTSLDMVNDTIVDLSKIPNIVGVKEASGDVSRVSDLINRCGEAFSLYSGDDGTTLAFIAEGGHGCISVTANVAPKLMHDMCTAALSGDMDLAKTLNDQLDPLHTALFLESNPMPAKWAVSEMGFGTKGIRLPLTVFSEKFHEQLRTAMSGAGVI